MSEVQMASVDITPHTSNCDINILKDLSNSEIISLLGLERMSDGDIEKFGWEETFSPFVPIDSIHPSTQTKLANFVGMDIPLTQTTTQATCFNLDSNLQTDGSSYIKLNPVQTQVSEVLSVQVSPSADEMQSGAELSYTTLSPVDSAQVCDISSSQVTETLAISPPAPQYVTLNNHLHRHQLPTSRPQLGVTTSWAATPEEDVLTHASSLSDAESCTESTSSFLGSPDPSSPVPRTRCRTSSGTQGSTGPRSSYEPCRDLYRPNPGTSGSTRVSNPPGRSSTRKRKPRERKTKLYERQEPFDDPKQEKKRQDAINSKRNRDRKKKGMDELRQQVEEAIRERDELKRELDALRKREQDLVSKIKVNGQCNAILL